MNRKKHCPNQKFLTYLYSSALVVLACRHTTLVVGQTGSDASTNSLAAREEELKRRESELLRSMGMAPDSALNQDNKRIETATSLVNDVSKLSQPATGGETSTTILQEKQERFSNDEALESLRAIENHPALQSKKKPLQTNLGRSGSIVTHRGLHTKNEGTARKIDTFRRVDQTRSFGSDNNDARTYSRLVSLQEIERGASRRPAPLADPSVATISVTPAKLRSGPSTANSTLGSLSKYSEVTIDYRSGEWYRVKTAAGQRGWVRGPSLIFDTDITETSTVKIGAVRAEPGSRVPR